MGESDKIINIRTGQPNVVSPTWAMLLRLIEVEGVNEVVGVVRDIIGDTEVNPFPNLPQSPELNDEVAEALRAAVVELERIEDRASSRE